LDDLDIVSALDGDELAEELYRLEERPRVSGAGAGLSESVANRTVSGRGFDRESFRAFVVSAKGNLKVSAGWLRVSGTVGFETGC
jgi:hypothetical protein